MNKVIHYCWFSKNPLPEEAKKCIESWKKFKPIYSKEYFAPLDWKTGLLEKTENTYGIHYGYASWLDGYDRKMIKVRHESIQKYGKK